MKLYLASWEEGHGESKNPNTSFVSGTDQWKMFQREREKGMQLRILLSYWYYKDADLDALFAKYFTPPYPDVFADSGAFSAMTQGVNISLKEYAAWIKKYQHLFSAYSNLDVIKDADATLKNQKQMEDMGLNPLPVFHVLESWWYLEYYVDKYPYIALGVAGMQSRRQQVMAWLVKCYKIAGKQSVFHGFALTSWLVMSSFPWYSVDSSSWGQGFRFGQVPLFDSQRGRFEKCKLGDYEGCHNKSRLFEDLGFNWLDFADRERNNRAKICAISALSYIKAEQFLRRKFGEIHIPNNTEAPVGLRAHLADANPQRFGDTAGGLKLHLADTGGIKENYARADAGVKIHLADARSHTAADRSAAQSGLKIHLAEHSLDRGGLGDTSRAKEILE